MLQKNSTNKEKKHTDINFSSLVFRAPKSWHPYISICRFDRPAGFLLLFWPCIWGLSLGAFPNLPALEDIILFFLGAILMRGAGCCFNDIVDRNLDTLVERSSIRPLPSGLLSLLNAYLTIFFLLSLSFLILIQFNFTTIILGLSSSILIILYPYMKRLTYWPQLFLGFTFNWGILLGFSVYPHNWSWPLFFSVILTYLSSIFWTLAYDTLYAHQDKEDDILVGVKSLALKMNSHSKSFIIFCYIIQAALLLYVGSFMKFSWLYSTCCIVASAMQIVNLKNINFNSPEETLLAFKKHILTGFIISLGFLNG